MKWAGRYHGRPVDARKGTNGSPPVCGKIHDTHHGVLHRGPKSGSPDRVVRISARLSERECQHHGECGEKSVPPGLHLCSPLSLPRQYPANLSRRPRLIPPVRGLDQGHNEVLCRSGTRGAIASGPKDPRSAKERLPLGARLRLALPSHGRCAPSMNNLTPQATQNDGVSKLLVADYLRPPASKSARGPPLG